MDHSRAVVARHGLDALVVPTTVVDVEPAGDGYRLHGADGTILDTRTLILAPGLRGHERVPAWARELWERDPKLATHVESIDVRAENVGGERVLVVGGGLSAATLAGAAAERGARVTLVSRHRLEARLFDADPGWVGPKYLTFFQSEPDPEARLRMIRRARGEARSPPSCSSGCSRGMSRSRSRDLLPTPVQDIRRSGVRRRHRGDRCPGGGRSGWRCRAAPARARQRRRPPGRV